MVKLIFESDNNYNEHQYDSFMHNVYTLSSVSCACCGKVMYNPNNTPIFNNDKNDVFYTFRPNSGNSVTYDPHNLPEEDPTGAFFTPVVADEEDYEGYEWRNFCKPCWERLKYKSDEYLYNKYPASEFE